MNPLREARAVCAAFGPHARSLRRTAGLSQRDLAKRALISRKYVQQIEYGKANPTLETLVLLACALDVELSEILPR